MYGNYDDKLWGLLDSLEHKQVLMTREDEKSELEFGFEDFTYDRVVDRYGNDCLVFEDARQEKGLHSVCKIVENDIESVELYHKDTVEDNENILLVMDMGSYEIQIRNVA